MFIVKKYPYTAQTTILSARLKKTSRRYVIFTVYQLLQISWKDIIAGDRDAYSEAYLSLYERFYNYGSKFTPDTGLVEDAIQEVLISLWIDRQKLSAVTNPDAYSFVSFRRALFKKIKDLANKVPVEDVQWEPEFSRHAILINQEIGAELQEKLQRALDTLTSRQREAIFLRFYEALSYEEVAEALGITVKATYKIVARGLLQLRKEMQLLVTLLFFLLHHA